MELIYKDEVLKLKYTFHSFKFMEELDLEVLSEIDRKPFKLIGLTQMLLMGALNNNPKVIYEDEVITTILEKNIEDGNLVELLEYLISLLYESSFFKSLQKTEVKPKKKK